MKQWLQNRFYMVGCLVGFVICAMSMWNAGCSSDVSVGVPGCESCPERCLQENNRGRCVGCLTDTHCQSNTSPTKKCTTDNRCICGSDKDCPDNQLCTGTGGCVECRSNADCKSADRSLCVANRCLRCEPKAIRACSPEGIDACVKGTQTCTNGENWSECQGWKTCKTGETCDKGQCVYACPSPAPCQNDQKSCTTGNQVLPGRYRVCTRDANQCFMWGTEQTCQAGEVCDKGACQPYTCPTAECKESEKRCDGTTHVQTCGKNQFGCLVWMAKEPCPTQQTCNKALDTCVRCEPGQTQACYTGDPKTQGVGICQPGQQQCLQDGSGFGACVGDIKPQQEQCDDQKDNNCDGYIDENCSCAYQQKTLGVCKSGQRDGQGICQPPKSYSPNEICGDNLDNNCDGSVDEGCPSLYLNLNRGVCANAQRDTQGQCLPPGGYQNTEVCGDNLDNNCDGSVDEGCAPALVIQNSINTSSGQIDGSPSSTWDSATGTFKAAGIKIPVGATVKVSGTRPLIMEATGDITVDGVLQASGETGNLGNATNSNPSGATGGSGGLGCCGGANGGKGGNSPSGVGTGGSGSGAGKQGSAQTSGQYVNGGGGGGAGHATTGYQGFNAVPGGGGGTYGDAQLSSLQGGSGGGGGSGGLGGASTGYGGSGGGGGGGVVKLISAGTITISATGKIQADGGAGGRCQNVGAWSGGGAGSGGSIWLSAKTIANSGQVTAIGGINCAMNGAPATAGQGGSGRIRVDTLGAITPTGSFSPSIGYVGSK